MFNSRFRGVVFADFRVVNTPAAAHSKCPHEVTGHGTGKRCTQGHPQAHRRLAGTSRHLRG